MGNRDTERKRKSKLQRAIDIFNAPGELAGRSSPRNSRKEGRYLTAEKYRDEKGADHGIVVHGRMSRGQTMDSRHLCI